MIGYKIKYKDIKFSEKIIEIGFHLTRIANSINSNHRNYLRVLKYENIKNPIIIRDLNEIILNHASIIYESLQSLKFSNKYLNTLTTWKNNNNTIKYLLKELSRGNSFTNKYVKIIRNKLQFHFYNIFETNELKSIYDANNKYFVIFDSNLKYQDSFVLTDEIIYNYLVNKITEYSTKEEKWNYFQNILFELSDKLYNLFYDLILEIFYNNLTRENISEPNGM